MLGLFNRITMKFYKLLIFCGLSVMMLNSPLSQISLISLSDTSLWIDRLLILAGIWMLGVCASGWLPVNVNASGVIVLSLGVTLVSVGMLLLADAQHDHGVAFFLPAMLPHVIPAVLRGCVFWWLFAEVRQRRMAV